jgi:hypothetical protein
MHPVNKFFEWFKKFPKPVKKSFCFSDKINFFYIVEVTNSDINANDFEEIIDEKTGKKVLRMKKEVAERKGLVNMDTIDFEFVIDEQTGQKVVQIKSNPGKLTKEHVSFEIITDPTTGQQTLRMKQEVEVKCKPNIDSL